MGVSLRIEQKSALFEAYPILYDSAPLTSHDWQVFRSHSYFRYTADPAQRVIGFELDWKMLKGFSNSEEAPFTYRRNYFAASCSLELPGFWCPTDIEYIEPEKSAVTVHRFAIGISALFPEGSPVELLQFTARRNKGKIGKPKIQDLRLERRQPQDGGADANDDDADAGDNDADGLDPQDSEQRSWEHTYRRLQFSRATPNNGRRIMAQKYSTPRLPSEIRLSSSCAVALLATTRISRRDREEMWHQQRGLLDYSCNPSPSFEKENLDDILDAGQSNGYSGLLPCDAASFPCLYLKVEISESRFDEGFLGDIREIQRRNGHFGRSNISLPPIHSSFNDLFSGPWANSILPKRCI